MITYEQDPDVFQWGLQLFDGDPYSNCGYGDAVTQNDPDYYHEHYFKEDYYNTGCGDVENDELTAHALQELSRLSVAEAPESHNEGVEHLQAPFYTQDWNDPSVGNYTFGHENGHEEVEVMGSCSSCSSPEGTSYCGEGCSYSLEITDEFALDGEVGKRLNQMVPIPHVPKINGEIPSLDEATLDHQRLLDRLQLYELVEFKVQGDGNCQFRALSDQFYRTQEHHKFLRQQVVNQLRSCREIYEGYVPMAYADYLNKMSKSGEWGDHVTLQAAADVYGVKIFVITSFEGTCYIEIIPNIQRSERVIFLSFWAEVHYNSIYPEGEVPAFEPKRERWWTFGDEQHLESANEYN